LDKSVEDWKGKLKTEEAKRKELENRVKQLSNESSKTEKAEEKPASVSNILHRVATFLYY